MLFGKIGVHTGLVFLVLRCTLAVIISRAISHVREKGYGTDSIDYCV